MKHAKCLLVVDDDPDIREALAAALEDHGFRVVTAADGGEALGVLEDRGPMPIVLDLMMPRMDGWTFLERLRANGALAGSPVVIVSAVAPYGVPAGAEAVLAKPFAIADLTALLDGFVRPPEAGAGPAPLALGGAA